MITIALTVITFCCLWFRNQRIWQLSYLLLLIIGLLTSSLSLLALVPAFLLAISLHYYQAQKPYALLAVSFALVIGLALGTHILPGFNNVQFVESARLSLSSASFDIWFNFDKSMFGLLVMGIVLHGSLIRSRADAQNTLSAVWLVALLGIVAVYAVGLLSGYSRFDWTPAAVFIPWALKNLVFTVVAEEVFFRGLLQNIVHTELAKRLPGTNAGNIAVLLAGVLFGLAHFGGGIHYVVLSSIAGFVYGYTYKLTGRIEAPILTHFFLNAGHFLFFAYPYSVV